MWKLKRTSNQARWSLLIYWESRLILNLRADT